jgi:hypothetical protein
MTLLRIRTDCRKWSDDSLPAVRRQRLITFDGKVMAIDDSCFGPIMQVPLQQVRVVRKLQVRMERGVVL